MAVQGNRKEQGAGYVKTYGLGVFEILGVNLTNQQLKSKGFWVKEGEENKERDFVGERDGNTTVALEFACMSVEKDPKPRKFTFYLENVNDKNKDEERPLYKFINDQGRTAWSKKPNEFSGLAGAADVYFTGQDDAYNPRPAKRGEESFMEFMRSCMAVDFKSGGTLKYNIKKFFNGNFQELKDDLSTDFLTTVLVATTIKLKETDEGVKEIETFYSYKFAPGSYGTILKNKGKWSESDIAAIHTKIQNNKGKKGKERQYVTPLEELIAKMTDKDYPCKDIYHIGTIIPYTGEGHIEASESTIISDAEQVEEEDDNTSRY